MKKSNFLINYWDGDFLLENLRNGLLSFNDKVLLLLVPLLTSLVSGFNGLKLITEDNANILKLISTFLNIFLVIAVIFLYRSRRNDKFIEEFLLLTVPAAIRSCIIVFLPLITVTVIAVLACHYLGYSKRALDLMSLSYFIIVPSRIYYCYYILRRIWKGRI